MKVVINPKTTQAAPQPKKVFNPLTALAESGSLVSTSLTNIVSGQCPKCNQSMSNALVGSEEVHYCKNCRVCEPMPLK